MSSFRNRFNRVSFNSNVQYRCHCFGTDQQSQLQLKRPTQMSLFWNRFNRVSFNSNVQHRCRCFGIVSTSQFQLKGPTQMSLFAIVRTEAVFTRVSAAMALLRKHVDRANLRSNFPD
ncbi:hypothetical protein PoB_000338800 [Plakobranchus ocellatus]|uniref:Uncharacterized protein n=1 Tax=Plakobranchus ocellatus TaxID=259542 RepID=A0AAV3Y3V0_9GAST|nr:hypothetical protein PoB_000338800 [Plakobranchus ocellatus]